MIEWIKTVFKNRPDMSTPITAKWLNDLQDYMISLTNATKKRVGGGSNQYGRWVDYDDGTRVINITTTLDYNFTSWQGMHRSQTYVRLPIEFIDTLYSGSITLSGPPQSFWTQLLSTRAEVVVHGFRMQAVSLTDITTIIQLEGKWK